MGSFEKNFLFNKDSSNITSRGEAHLGKYLRDIQSIPMIKPEDEVLLGAKIKEGDKKAINQLVKGNLRFVVSVAKKYAGQSRILATNDLVNEGNYGLIEAAKRFDETKGFKFITYASKYIRRRILEAIRDAKTVRLPDNIDLLIARLSKEINSMENGELSFTDSKNMSFYHDNIPSLDEPIAAEGSESSDSPSRLDMTSGDLKENPESILTTSNTKEVIAKMVNELTSDENIVMRLRYGLPYLKDNFLYENTEHGITEITDITGLGYVKVQNLIKSATNKLKSKLDLNTKKC